MGKDKDIIYKKLIEHMEEAVWIWDRDERSLFANEKFCKLVWYSMEEVLWKKSYDFWDEDSVKKVKKINNKDRKKWISSSYSWNLLTKKWKKIPVILNGTPLPDGWSIGIMTDLTKVKEKEHQEKILYQAIEHATDAIIMCNDKWDILSWNSWAKIIFGYNKKIIWKNIDIIFKDEDLENIIQKKETVTKYQLLAKHSNKEIIYISMTQTHVYDKEARKTVYLLSCRDISNYKKIEEDNISKHKKLQEVYLYLGRTKRENDYIFDLLRFYQENFDDKKALCNFVVNSIMVISHVNGCELRLYDEKDDSFEMISHFGFSQDGPGKKKIPFKWSLAGEAFKLGETLKVLDIFKETKYQTPALARKHGMTSLLLIPLISKWTKIGILVLYTKDDKKLEIFENEFIEKYAKVVSLVLS